ncbi:MAG: T9SS type A sorting domain-containing protein [bacterium]|nr:T9SS type A sorting domain-containing protein [bacterium]
MMCRLIAIRIRRIMIVAVIRLPLLFLFSISQFLISPKTVVADWEKTYKPGDGSTKYCCSAGQTQDGGYALAGWAWCSPDVRRVYLIKTDQAGNLLWTKRYTGVANHDEGYSVAETQDGGYIIAGFTGEMGPSIWCNAWLIKTNSSGDTIWTKMYGSGGEGGYSVAQTTDGGYIVAGISLKYGPVNWDIYLIKTDSAGNSLWTKTYGGPNNDYGYSVAQTEDGGYIIAGYTKSYGAGGYDVYLIKTDKVGDILWTKTYGGTRDDYGYSVAQTEDGGYIIAGETKSYGTGTPLYSNVYLIKTDPVGNTLWTKTYGGASSEMGYSVAQTQDGGYITAGLTFSWGGSPDAYLIKTDPTGVAETSNVYKSGYCSLDIVPTIGTGIFNISFYIPSSVNLQSVSLIIYDAAGRLVETLVSVKNEPGYYNVTWSPKGFKAGVYFVKFTAGNFNLTKKLILIQ